MARQFPEIIRVANIDVPILDVSFGHYPGSFRNMFAQGWHAIGGEAQKQSIQLASALLYILHNEKAPPTEKAVA